ncbi:MAG: porin family protein [Proteobacteria bacterium]|jgi:hypothetical protein|nr:porin family protein [Pseudomonadota bacterium]
MKTSKLAICQILSLLFITLPCHAEFFLGADYTAFGTQIDYTNTYSTHYTDPVRLRVGYQGNVAGVELDFMTKYDDNNTNANYNFDIKSATGLYLYVHHKWIYGKLGGIWSQTSLTNNQTNVTDDYTLFQLAAAIGAEIELASQLYINGDITFAQGTGNYPTVGLPGGEDATVTSQIFALGLTYRF